MIVDSNLTQHPDFKSFWTFLLNIVAFRCFLPTDPFGAMKIPKHIDIPAAWYGDELKNNTDLWSYQLSSEEIGELENAALDFNESGEPIGTISKKSFFLPSFGPFLAELKNELREGLGFKLIRGLPVERYDPATWGTSLNHADFFDASQVT